MENVLLWGTYTNGGVLTAVPVAVTATGELIISGGGGSVTFQTDSFVVSGFGPYTLSQTPNGDLTMVFFDGVLQPDANYSIATDELTIAGTVDTAFITTLTVIYAYT
jgi:hypothetical protein